MSSRNIDARPAHIRVAREHYRQTNPENIAEIETMARDVAKPKPKPCYESKIGPQRPSIKRGLLLI